MGKFSRYTLIFLSFFALACTADPSACFTSNQENTEVFNPIQFSNCSTDSDEYLWDFGDGNQSTDQQPIHAYSDTGIFQVSLQASSHLGGKSSIHFQEIYVGSPIDRFKGTYHDEDLGDFIEIKAGNYLNSSLILYNQAFLCNSFLKSDSLFIELQNLNSSTELLIHGSGNLSNDSLFIEFIYQNELGPVEISLFKGKRI